MCVIKTFVTSGKNLDKTSAAGHIFLQIYYQCLAYLTYNDYQLNYIILYVVSNLLYITKGHILDFGVLTQNNN